MSIVFDKEKLKENKYDLKLVKNKQINSKAIQEIANSYGRRDTK
jgi:hypothetical protein